MCCFALSIALRAFIVVLSGVAFVQSLFVFNIVPPSETFLLKMSELLHNVMDKSPSIAQDAAQRLLTFALVPSPGGVVLSVTLLVLFICVVVRETCVR